MPKKTIKLSANPVTAATSFFSAGQYVERSESVAERVDKWFIEPLRRMQGSEGFLVLLVLFPLYEKHLRNHYDMIGDFSEGNPIFSVIGKHIQLSKKDAYRLWTHLRNGLLHHAAPKNTEDFEYCIRDSGPPVEKIADRFWINPFSLRDRLLEEIEPDTRTWKTDEVPLAKTFIRVEIKPITPGSMK
jgi:hypothetical protein